MATITIENVPDNLVKIYGTKIIYTKEIIFPRKDENGKSLAEYLKSDEYIKDEGVISTMDDFICQLENIKNKK